MTRNEEIKQSIENLEVPVLPFELAIAKDAMIGHIASQRELGQKMGEAMNQSSETWHDNAPAEALTAESKTLAKIAERTIGIINSAKVFEYEATDMDEVTLGSIVDIRYGKSSNLDRLVLTGVSRQLTPEIAERIEMTDDTEVITLSSPVGRAIFGKKAGEVTSFTAPNGREISLTIEAVSQI